MKPTIRTRRAVGRTPLLFAILAVARASDFRNADWGMDKEQVRKVETAQYSAKGSGCDGRNCLLLFVTSVGNKVARLGYVFVDDKLVSAKYIFDEPHEDPQAFVSEFREIDRVLVDKYGRPNAQEERNWSELYPDDLGRAILSGAGQMATHWETVKTIIIHVLKGDNSVATHGVEYDSVAFEHLRDEEERERDRKDF